MKIRRQLEYTIAASKGIILVKPPSTMQAVLDIVRIQPKLTSLSEPPLPASSPPPRPNPARLWTGFRLHLLRDTSGTALYFAEYDSLRYIMGRLPSGEQGPTPSWLPIHSGMVPFLCGSISGVTSWAVIYPLDVYVWKHSMKR